MNKSFVFILFLLLVIFVLRRIYKKNFKSLVYGCIVLITGGVKTGKSLTGSTLSDKEYKKRWKRWFITTKLLRLKIEEPLYYTNSYHSFGKTRLGKRLNKNIRLIELDLLLRKKRFAYKSVVSFTESSLVADNMDYKNDLRNARLSLFNKLFGHETKGGILFYDTQSIEDNHYSIKRVVSSYFYIQKSRSFWLFRVLYVREMISVDIGQNNVNSDLDDTMKKILIFRWWYKHYDCYYFSHLTDDLEVSSVEFIPYNRDSFVSFNPLYLKLAKNKKKGVSYDEK